MGCRAIKIEMANALRAGVKMIFDEADTDKDGRITAEEWDKACANLPPPDAPRPPPVPGMPPIPPAEVIEAITAGFDQADADGSGDVDFEEFYGFMLETAGEYIPRGPPMPPPPSCVS